MSKPIKELLESHGFKFSKSMGQNFLIDANIPEKIVRLSGIEKSNAVLEVGPGIGALTRYLSASAGKVVAVELDGKVLPMLAVELEGLDNVEVVQGDILKIDIENLVNEKMQGFTPCVCANLPYNITSPAVTKLIDSGAFDFVTVMVQREVARRMCAKPGSSDYSAFTVYINYHTHPDILFDVPPECFMPRPKVHSAVVKMNIRKERLLSHEDEKRFFKVVRGAFGQRRKTLVNALYGAFGATMQKEEIAEIVTGLGLGSHVRGETLGIDEFIKLSQRF